MKSGIQTSEFWLSVFTALISILAAFGVQVTDPDKLVNALAIVAAFIANAIVAAVYTTQRSRLKAAALPTSPAPLISPVPGVTIPLPPT